MAQQPGRLFNRNFFLLWQGQFISKLGNEAHYIALAFWIKHATGSAALMGTILMLATLPRVVLGPFAGAFADSHSRRRVIIVADLVCGIAVMSLTVLLFLVPERTNLLLVWMFITTTVVASAASFFQPAFSAAVPDLVPKEKIPGANSANAAMIQIASLVGMGAGGVLFRVLGAPLLFLYDAFSYIMAAGFSSLTSIPQTARPSASSLGSGFAQMKLDVKEGLKYVWKQTGLRALFIFAAAINFFFTPIAALAPFFVEDTLKSTSDWFGYMMAAMGAGSMLGYLGAGTIKLQGRTRSWVMVVAIVVMSGLLGATGLVRTPVQLVALVFFSGILNGYININIATILQTTTPSGIRGRVFGLMTTLSAGLTPLAMGLSGIVADLVHRNISAIFVTCGVMAVIISLAVSFSREFRKYLAYETKPVIIDAAVEAQADQQ